MTTVTSATAPVAEPLRRFWHDSLAEADPAVAAIIGRELGRQRDRIELIASENIASPAVLEATGSVFTNKYAEGYPGKRYYGGCDFADEVETLAIERAKELFNCGFANVQPNSGSQMNQAVFLALLEPGDTFMGLDLAAGGHLTHGSPVNMSGKWFKAVPYGVRREDQRLDMDEIREIALKNRPKLIICGGTAYPRLWDFAAFRAIADEVGAWLLADMSHFSGLVAGGVHPSPFPHAHVVTTTTHKSLRGPRSGVILTNDADLAKKFNMAVFPGMQGGPLMHVIAGKAVAFGEALRPEFKAYAASVVENAKALAASLQERGLDIVSGGTDNHLMLVNLTSTGVSGKATEAGLDRAFLTCNKNAIPFDERSPFVTSGVRLGTPAGTTRGFGPAEFRKVGELIAEVVEGMRRNGDEGDAQVEESVRRRVIEMCEAFPVYPGR
ncbi:serine hydroxymethyltransferase [Altererythrobacter xixiisoli]|uniref:Serine hydroxymethyltransferase n=1 Tax=Croceibacterium xixiisoli TaxID=1476466 RepID=A0A6I4U0M1_9SPHN|nr:serine hydroxymethyltransferase [Croceibacterium xixiisoli]MXP00880.1 serine hydroxymethyltransferase [Croceibacterium xixiisoli]